MWIPRTADEVTQWHAATRREALTEGLLIAGGAWLGVGALWASGWLFNSRLGVFVPSEPASGGFWGRFQGIAIVGLPFAYWLFRHLRKRHLASASRRTVCAKCDTSSEGNAETACNCGGAFVPLSTVRWVEEEPSETGDLAEP